MGNPLRRVPPAVLALAIVAVRPGAAQGPPPPRQTPDLLVPVSTEVVRIDVVVTDKGGRPKQGLTQESFVVLEDGQPQQIAQFEAFVSEPSPGSPPATAPISQAAADAEEVRPARPMPPRRWVVLAIDDVHIEAGNLLRIRKSLDRFIERELGPEDQVALVTTSGTAGLYQEFTDDREALRKSVARLSVQDRTVKSAGVPHITEYQAEQIDRGDQEALRVAVEEIVNFGQLQDAASAEVEARAVARAVLAESISNARLTLDTLDGVVRSLSELRGRKVLVLVSDGFLPGLTTSSAAFDIRRIGDAGTRAGVVIYTLDTRGLVATPTGRSASSRMPMLASTFSAQDQMLRESEYATRDAMSALAADTGGFLVQGTNDLGTGLRRILKDTENYYLIAYESTNTRRDGTFRKLEVRLPGLRDFRIRARKGYFAPNDRKTSPSAPPATVAESVVRTEDRRESEMKMALTSLAPLGGIPVRLSADFVSVDAAGPQVVVSSHVDLNGVPFAGTGGRHVATVDSGATVFDESGAVVGSLEIERAAMDLTDASYEQALKGGLEYQKAAPVKPGRYRVRVAVREDGEGKLGSASQWVQVPDLAQGRLTLSSLFLLKEGSGPEERSAATSAGGGLSLRGTQALRRFKRGETLYVQHFAYNPARDATGATNLVTQAEIWRGGVLLASSAPESVAPGDTTGPPVAHTRSIKLAPFGPGDYEVRIVLTDRNANEMTSRRVGFTIE